MSAHDKQPPPSTADGADAVAAATAAEQPLGDTSVASEPAPGGAEAEFQRQLDEHRDRHLRLAAEFDNARRRWNRERDETRARAQADLVSQLLEALDDIGRFADLDPATTPTATIVEGVDMVERKLAKALGAAGLEVLDPTGQPFDPAFHEAVSVEPTPSRDDDNIVARTYQRGYRFAGQLLRPARVVVKQHGG